MAKKKNQPSIIPTRQHDSGEQLGLERMIFFSDAVFAIAITLLALEIRLPVDGPALNDTQLFELLMGMWQRYLAFMISFLVIGVFWMAHHRKFQYIKSYDSRLLFLNLLLLMVIAFLPFPSSLISQYSERSATVFYALTVMLAGIMMALIWWYASSHHRLIDPVMNPSMIRREYLAPLSSILVFLLSIGIEMVTPGFGRLSWMLILPVSLLINLGH